MNNRTLDFAIIGGGVSGVYSAWRLKKAHPDKNIQLFEYSNRIGGKLMTVQLPDMPDVNAELGGMRIIPGEQKLIMGLVEAMGLQLKLFPMGAKDDPTGKNNFAYFRETHMKVGDLSNSDMVPYALDWAERGHGPNQLQAQVMNMLVPNWASLESDDWFDVEVLGKPLWKWGFWNLLYEVLTPEGYQFIREACGYDTNVSNGNAVNLLPTGGEYDGSDTYQTPVDGMESIPVATAKQFKDLDGEINFNQFLRRIVRNESGLYELTFSSTRTLDGHTSVLHDQPPTTLTAEHVILAMPRASLEAIEWDQWQADDFLRENIPSVLIQDAFKLVLGYEYPWWETLGVIAGRSLSDLPIRQTLYFGQEVVKHCNEEGPQKAPVVPEPGHVKCEKALLMASYNDISTVPFWKGLEKGQPFGKEPRAHLATEKMVEQTHKQVMELHGQEGILKPFAAAYRDWSAFPFGGAWHSWKAGYKYNDICARMTHPVETEKVYICGEAYSMDQGWAEGALETAEQMLTESLGVESFLEPENQSDPMRRLRY